MMIKSNHHSKSVNKPTEQNMEVPDNFHFTVSYYVACSSSDESKIKKHIGMNCALSTTFFIFLT